MKKILLSLLVEVGGGRQVGLHVVGSEQAELSRKVNKPACRSEVFHRQAVPRLRRAPWRGAMVGMLTLLCFAMALEKEIDIFPEQGG